MRFHIYQTGMFNTPKIENRRDIVDSRDIRKTGDDEPSEPAPGMFQRISEDPKTLRMIILIGGAFMLAVIYSRGKRIKALRRKLGANETDSQSSSTVFPISQSSIIQQLQTIQTLSQLGLKTEQTDTPFFCLEYIEELSQTILNNLDSSKLIPESALSCKNREISSPPCFEKVEISPDKKIAVPPTTYTSTPKIQHRNIKGTSPASSGSLPGIDIDAGLEMFGGNMQSFKKLLLDFSEKHANTAVVIRCALEKDDTDLAWNIVHTVTLAAGIFSEKELYTSALNLEMGIRHGNKDYLEPLLNHFEATLARVMKSIRYIEQDNS